MTDVITLLINKEGVDLNVKDMVCLDLPWRHFTPFFLCCLSVSVAWSYTSPSGNQKQDDS
jgi:hypothetical protein